ncbi:hypothetical protein V6617_08110 [Pelagibacterium nitratireducens]|uniref:Uncharacterized protein n=1 Tax=Pelagibacterium nitratireducens TaxID=1046114 RepID=A0ABZ2I907_9HYPH
MSEVSSSRRMVATLVFLIFGPICWALQLTAVYGGQSALCAFGSVDQPLVSGWVLAVSVLAGLACGAGIVWTKQTYTLFTGGSPAGEQWSFLAFVMRALSALSLLAIAYAAIGAIMLPACGGLR